MSANYHHGNLRRALIDAAVEALEETDPSSLSLRNVAKRAGVSHAAPAHHFKDKTGLFTAVAAQGFQEIAQKLASEWEVNHDFLELGVTYVKFAVDHPAYFSLMFHPELLNVDDPEFNKQSNLFYEILVREAGINEDGTPIDEPDSLRWRPFAAWSIVHGCAELIINNNFPSEIIDGGDEAIRNIISRIK